MSLLKKECPQCGAINKYKEGKIAIVCTNCTTVYQANMINQQDPNVQALKNTMLQAESGAVNSDDKLVDFIYTLLREHLTAGDVESITRSVEDNTEPVFFCNGWLAEYAKNIAKRLK